MNDKIVIALDYETLNDIPEQLLNYITRKKLIVKIGPVLLMREGTNIFYEFDPTRILLDMKFYDTPITVAKTCNVLKRYNLWGITVHVAGGKEMMENAVINIGDKTKVFGITRLTSKKKNDKKVEQRIIQAGEMGLDGVQVSGGDLVKFHKQLGKYNLETLVPGIYINNIPTGQKRIVHIKEALDNGADHCVIGRTLTGQNPMPFDELDHYIPTSIINEIYNGLTYISNVKE